MGNKKVKEEYIFDQNDFDEYVKYCEKRKEYFVPKKETYKVSKFLNIVFYFSFYCGTVPTIINGYFFLLSLLNNVINNYATSLFIVSSTWMICVQLLDLIAIRKNNKYIAKLASEIEENYIINYQRWYEEIKTDYIKDKKKEFSTYLKYKKLKEKEIKVIKYWMPSWIYFIIRKSDNIVKYVGQTIDLKNRRNNHYKRKYPNSDFLFEPIERLDVDEIDQREKFWIDGFGKINLDNKSKGGSAIHHRKGFKRKDVPYKEPEKEEIERVEKWLKFIKNKIGGSKSD